MRETGGRGQGPGRGPGGAGSQGGPGAARRTPGRAARPGRPGSADDPFDLPFQKGGPARDDGPPRRAPQGDDRPPRRVDGDPVRRRPPGEGRTTDPGGRVPPPRGGTPRREDTARPQRPPRPPGPPPRPPLVLRLGNPRRRINVGLIAMAFVLSILGGRLIQMQGIDSKRYEVEALNQRTLDEVIQAKRGSITDVNGHALALTVEAREVAIDPSVVHADARAKVAGVLAAQLGKPQPEIAAKLAKEKTRYQLLAKDVDPVVAARLVKAQVPGLTAQKQYRRVYPAGDLAGTIVGFVGDDNTGLGGLEEARNSVLTGHDGKQSVERGRDGQRIPMTRTQREAPVDGSHLRLTIDRDVQWAAQVSIAEQVRRSEADSGTVIVMDVRTAQVVAMANAPELDLINWRKAPPSHYVNRAAAEVFEPGSTNKVITAAAALEGGHVRPGTVFQVKDNIKCYDRVLRDAEPHPTEKMTFEEAIAKSSNVATIMAARKVGSQDLHRMLRAFGFGAKPGGGVPGEEAGLLPDYRAWSGSQSCTVAYGQGVSVTALQMASVYQTVANGGVRIPPQLVAGTTDPKGVFTPAPAGKRTRVVSERTAQEITAMLERAVSDEGTGNLAAIPGYRVAGKTGTANRYDQRLGRYDGYTASFVGFAPADAPEVVVLSVLQNPKKEHFGGQVAAPVFKDVMTFAIKSRKIPPTVSAAPQARMSAGQ
ncbi:penicillin-binding protein 2 [Nonomuraea longicatena]|uniref:Cell division protein FtsI n=1 Tax=Nonomuraea longicatena TaxID=83682 RepID=A0ABP4B0W5_9ACTN